MLVYHLDCHMSLNRKNNLKRRCRWHSPGGLCRSRLVQVGQEDDTCVNLADMGTFPHSWLDHVASAQLVLWSSSLHMRQDMMSSQRSESNLNKSLQEVEASLLVISIDSSILGSSGVLRWLQVC